MAARAHAAHAVFFPFPAQGHVAAVLHLARLLHAWSGVCVTFVHSEHNRRRLLWSCGPDALAGASGFTFASVPDGLPLPSGESEEDDHSPEHMAALLAFIEASVPHLGTVLNDAAAAGSPATCVVSDIESVLRATREVFVLPAVGFWATSACGLMSGLMCQQLIDRGLVPLNDEEQLRNGYLDTVIDWALGMPKDMRLRDFVGFIRTTDPNDPVLRIVIRIMDCLRTAPSAIILNTFDELEAQVLHAMSSILPPIYIVGPLPLLAEQCLTTGGGGPLSKLSANLSKEDDGCLAWLGTKQPRSVVYANFGSIAVLTSHQLREFAWGLACSGYDFLLVIRKDQARDTGGPAAVLTPEFEEETTARGRAYVASWCPQAEVLRHEAVGTF